MNIKHAPFDLIREKEELDAFLSTFAPQEAQDALDIRPAEDVPQPPAAEAEQKTLESVPAPTEEAESAAQVKTDESQKELPETVRPPLPPKKTVEKPPKKTSPEPQEETADQDRTGWRRTAILFIIWMIVTFAYFWMYPSHLPFYDRFTSANDEEVQLIDVRQRFVEHIVLGNIRIVEGTAINKAAHPRKDIRVIGKLYGPGETLLAVQASYCGNTLTDEQMGSLSEDSLRAAFSVPPPSDMPVSSIAPGGRIPFMIVFIHEPAGVARATVALLNAEQTSS